MLRSGRVTTMPSTGGTSKTTTTVDALVADKKAQGSARATEPDIPNLTPADLDESQFPVLKNTISYEEIVGEAHPDGLVREYPVPFSDWEFPEFIPTPDPLWVPDHDTLPNLLGCIMYGHNGIVVGEPGTGKTKDVREVCARIKMPYHRFNGMEGLEPADLLGQNQLINGQTIFVDGALMPAVRGGGVQAIDEPFKIPAGTLMACQWLAESDKAERSVMLYGHEDTSKIRVQAHPEFRMVLCDNCRGTGDNMDMYAATNVQDQSFINRMDFKMRKTYMSPPTEQRAIMTAYPWILPPLAKKMTAFAAIMREAWNQGAVEMPFSFRELQAWSLAIAEFNGMIVPALNVVFGNILEDGEEKEIYNKALNDAAIH
jgi:MoxR-like ATPase